MSTKPERWSLVRIDDNTVKVMGVWSSGYLYGDSWKLNSGIESIEEGEDAYLFHGFSGSCYECRKDAYGINTYGLAVLDGAGLKPMSEEDALVFINVECERGTAVAHHDLLDVDRPKDYYQQNC